MGFVHLHLHSEYSLLDGACRIAEIPKRAKELSQTAVAITDHGVMYGVVDFYRACKAEGIKPIIGCEVYVAAGSRFDKRHESDSTRYHLVLLVKNEIGYKNLCYMVSKAFTEGFYTKPRIDLELLSEHSEGLICLSACLAGYLPRLLASGEYEKAKEHALQMQKLFGKDSYYLELQDHSLEEQTEVNRLLLRLSDEAGIPLVATNDAHYLRRGDADTQAVLLCIQTNNKIADGRPFGFETDEFYMKSTEEMESLFGSYPDAIKNTEKIASLCNFDFDFSKQYLPRFRPETGEAPDLYLRRLANEGFEQKTSSGEIVFTEQNSQEVYRERIDYELSVIIRMGYSEYYLIVADFIAYAKKNGIPVGPGRGSGAGSLVAYLIGITDVDSVKHHLMFERFLNPERVSMPDFDTDFCYDRRGEVIEYVAEKYGRDHVCGITTFGTLAAKAVIRDVGRVLGMSYADTDIVAKAIPNDLHITIDKAMEDGPLSEMYRNNEQVRRLIDIARALEGMPRHASAHAAGIVITEGPLYDYVPVAVNDEMILTQFPMDTVARLGLLKFDFLGLRYLTILSDTEKQIRLDEPSFSLKAVPIDDTASYELISSGKTDGIFQLESAGMRKLLTQMHPERFDDIILAISIYRPGPMDSIPRFLYNRQHPDAIRYSCPQLKSILDETSGCILYQEQVMTICREIAGFSYGRADIIRRAMAKKKAKEMENERHAFIFGEKDKDGKEICHGAIAAGVSEETATEIFDTMSAFAEYAFNKSHAAAYAYIAFRTAYLKAHYPCEYLASLLTSVLGNMTKTAIYIEQAKKMRIAVLGPDINVSRETYSVVSANGQKSIRFGLLGIKNVGRNFLSAVINERKSGSFSSFEDFVSRMSGRELNKRQVESLIKSGAFDSLGTHRASLLSEYEKIIDIHMKKIRARLDGQLDLFSIGDSEPIPAPTSAYVYPDLPMLSVKERLYQEKESMGMYFSGHPFDEYEKHAVALAAVPINDVLTSFEEGEEMLYHDKDTVTVAGIILSRINKATRNGASMAFLKLEDKLGEIELVIFPKVLEAYSYLLSPDVPIAALGELSVAEDAPPKLLVSKIELLKADVDESDIAPMKKASAKRASASDAPTSASVKTKTLYLRLEGDTLPPRAMSVLDIFDGPTPIVLYDATTKKYSRFVGRGVSVEPNMLKLLKSILGEDSVVIK